MLLNAYSVYDVKSLTYSPPFFQPAHGSAARMFSDLANDANTSVGRHPADYSLFCLGLFDDQTGKLLALDQREHIADAVSFVQKQQPFNFPDPGNVMAAK